MIPTISNSNQSIRHLGPNVVILFVSVWTHTTTRGATSVGNHDQLWSSHESPSLTTNNKSSTKNKHNANQYQLKSLRISCPYGYTNKWTNHLLHYCHHPLLVPPHPSCWFGTTCWNTTWNSWVNLFVRLSIQELSKNILHYVDINFYRTYSTLHQFLPSMSLLFPPYSPLWASRFGPKREILLHPVFSDLLLWIFPFILWLLITIS